MRSSGQGPTDLNLSSFLPRSVGRGEGRLDPNTWCRRGGERTRLDAKRSSKGHLSCEWTHFEQGRSTAHQPYAHSHPTSHANIHIHPHASTITLMYIHAHITYIHAHLAYTLHTHSHSSHALTLFTRTHTLHSLFSLLFVSFAISDGFCSFSLNAHCSLNVCMYVLNVCMYVSIELHTIHMSLKHYSLDICFIYSVYFVILQMLRSPTARRALLVGCGLQMIQQVIGINTVMYYSGTIKEFRDQLFKLSTQWCFCYMVFSSTASWGNHWILQPLSSNCPASRLFPLLPGCRHS